MFYKIKECACIPLSKEKVEWNEVKGDAFGIAMLFVLGYVLVFLMFAM